MRNLKKLLAVIVTIAMVATFAIPAFAADLQADTQKCADIGMLIGGGDGVTAEYAATTPTRIQAAVMYLRLKGIYEEAAAYEGTETFADADEAAWAGPIMAYLKANPSLGFIGDGANFNPTDKIGAQEYYKVLLTALGYEVPADFAWEDTLAFAEEKGLAMGGDVADFTVNALATATVEALLTNVKDGSTTLIAALVADGKVDQAAAIDAGLIADGVTATAAATGAKKLTVTFNRAVDDTKAAITVKKGTVNVNVDSIVFAADKKSAVITTTAKLTKGDYTVNVAGLTDEAIALKVTAADEKVADINLLSETAPRGSDTTGSAGAKTATVKYEVLNQYGERMTNQSINVTASTGNPSGATSTNSKATGEFTITAANGDDFIPGATVYITCVNTKDGVVDNDTVTIGLASKADKLVFKGIYDTSKSELKDLPAGFDKDNTGKFVLLYEVLDQYGNKITGPVFSDVVFTNDNPLFVSSTMTAGTDVIIDDVTYEAITLLPGSEAKKGGTVKIQAISTSTGTISSHTITAEALAAPKTFTIAAPADIIAEDERTVIPFTAVDQYGNAITDYDSLVSEVTFSPAFNAGVGLQLEEKDDGTAELVYYSPETGATSTVNGAAATTDLPVYLTSLVTKAGDFSSMMVYVKDFAIPYSIIGTDAEKGVAVAAAGGKVDVKAKDLIIQDQYGRTMKDTKVNDFMAGVTSGSVTYNFDIKVTSKCAATGNNYDQAGTTTPFLVYYNDGTTLDATDREVQTITGATDYVSIIGKSGDVATPSEVITYQLIKTAGGPAEAIAASDKALTYTRYKHSQYTSYEVKDLGLMYNDGAATTASPDADYDKEITVYGVLANGTKVELPNSDFEISTTDKLGYTSTASVDTLTDLTSGGYDKDADFKDTATGKYTKQVTAKVLVTVVDTANNSALAILNKDVTLSNEAPKVATIVTDADGDFKVTDGKASINPKTTTTVSGKAYGNITNAHILSYLYTVADQYGANVKFEDDTTPAWPVSSYTTAPNITISGLTKEDGSKFAVTGNGTASADITGAIQGDSFTATIKYGTGASVEIKFTVGLVDSTLIFD